MIMIIYIENLLQESNISIGVSPTNTDVPVLLKQHINVDGLHINFVLHITKFSTNAPPSSTFNVPSTCGPPSVGQQFMKNADHPSLIMPPFMMDPTVKVFKKMTELGKH